MNGWGINGLFMNGILNGLLMNGILNGLLMNGIPNGLLMNGIPSGLLMNGIPSGLLMNDSLNRLINRCRITVQVIRLAHNHRLPSHRHQVINRLYAISQLSSRLLRTHQRIHGRNTPFFYITHLLFQRHQFLLFHLPERFIHQTLDQWSHFFRQILVTSHRRHITQRKRQITGQ